MDLKREISAEFWKKLAEVLEVETAALRAVAEIESRGSGFLPAPAIRPKVLFEGHAFHKLTGGRYDRDHPNLSHPKWDRRQYSGSLEGEWKRLDQACLLDRAAALQSASWGMFQIMGFNYSYAGYLDVEAFVADQHAGAEEHARAFARFISRPPFLNALRKLRWAEFARAYNGPGYAQNKYDTKMAAAYARHKAAAPVAEKVGKATKAAKPRKGRGKAAAESPLPPGRESFAVTQSTRRRNPRRRNVRPDPVDLRDWVYQPTVAIAPRDWIMPNDPRTTKAQGDTNACTGFALATAIEYLLDRGGRPVEGISGYMLYDMARRYDEWADDDGDSGSSLRGVLKGWSRHGASASRLWETLAMPPAPRLTKRDLERLDAIDNVARLDRLKLDQLDEDWWLDAVKRPMGAYYRVPPENIRDMHIALAETGVLVASAFTHSGWDLLLNEKAVPGPTAPSQLSLIKYLSGAPDQGHAFAIVGYTRDGFIVQNSWGPKWGRGGFAVLRYQDWLENAMDCWVVQLGVVTAEHDDVAKAPSLRYQRDKGEPVGRVVLSSDSTLADHEIDPFVINMENEGRLSQRGRFRTNPEDLELLLDRHLTVAQRLWKPADATIDVAIYAHGGLTDEEAAAKTARAWIPYMYARQVFPIFLMWETGGLKTIANIFEDAVRGEDERAGGVRWDRFRKRFVEWKDERIEGLARQPGRKIWKQMTQNANALSGKRNAGVIQLFEAFRARNGQLPPIRLHLIGHSAGAIVHTYLAERALVHGLGLKTMCLLAPAVRLDLFDEKVGPAIAAGGLRLMIANLTDAAERADDTCRPYGHSLLYLVSRAFKDNEETALLGMEKHLVPALVTHPWGERVTQLPSPGRIRREGSKATRAVTHGGIDDDEAVREAVMDFIKQPAVA
ncbi:MAG TPA: N-acetylmuramidase domain-containing protein [Luteimonas sp.]|nr:N-acetylmuramidase domain-containing protein [Luteimonas sp.]HRP71694.1 N-acetylmuramidase domain-containing protein [Luteimonas sp.]